MSMPERARLAREAQDVFRNAEREGREISPAEKRHVEGLLNRVKAMGGTGLTTTTDHSVMTDPRAHAPATRRPEKRFTMSKGYEEVKDSSRRPQSWSTGLVDVGLQSKGTLLESRGGWRRRFIPVPQVVPGVVD